MSQYHMHWCPRCKERWCCGGAYNVRGPCPGFRPNGKAAEGDHPWHKVFDLKETTNG